MRTILAVSVALLILGGVLRAEEGLDPAKISFTGDILPVLQQRCAECHGGENPTAGIAFDQYQRPEQVLQHRKTWEKVLHNVRARVMPPKEEPPLEPRQIELITVWVEHQLGKVDCSAARDPGRPTIRRLNRFEYNHTVRDLLGVNFEPANDFPSDDVGYGFDNIGDVLSLPPLLLEKYLAAAEKIVSQAIRIDGGRIEIAIPGERLAGDGNPLDNARGLFSAGEAHGQFEIPLDGTYVVRVACSADQAGPEPAKMALRIDGRQVHAAEIQARRGEGSPQVVEHRLPLKAGGRRIGAYFLNDYYKPEDPDPKNRDRNLYVHAVEIHGPLDFRWEQLPETHRRIFLAPPDAENPDEAARRILRRFTRRAFRRPVQDEEIENLLRLVRFAREQGDSFEQGIALALQAVLVSPHFLFRIERDLYPDDPNKPHPVSEHELATRLSYFLWSTMPDEELLDLADRGQLRANLPSQVQRMLRDPKIGALAENFGAQWLQIRRIETAMPDPKMFPGAGTALKSAMLQETLLSLRSVIDEDRSILDLIDLPYTYVNERLAKHYGIPEVKGEEFRRVNLEGDLRARRGGILVQGSVLLVTSNPTRTSPVKRGKWILEQILGTPPPPPPPEVEELSEDEKEAQAATLRQRLEMHRSANSLCFSCHSRMDPLGFALENYDAVGRWREMDGAFPVDSAGELPDGTKVEGPQGLKHVVKQRAAEFRRCLVEKMLTYALGRGLEYYDKCAVDDIVKGVAQDGDRFSAVVLHIVNSDPFQKRRAKRGDP